MHVGIDSDVKSPGGFFNGDSEKSFGTRQAPGGEFVESDSDVESPGGCLGDNDSEA